MAYYKLNRLYLQIWNNHGLRLDLGLGAVEVRLSVCGITRQSICPCLLMIMQINIYVLSLKKKKRKIS